MQNGCRCMAAVQNQSIDNVKSITWILRECVMWPKHCVFLLAFTLINNNY